MAKIVICRGIPGSGKTTYAKQWVLKDPEHRVRINKDDIRNMLGKYWVPLREPLVHNIYINTLYNCVQCGFDIIIDNMNLNHKESEFVEQYIKYWNHWKNPIKDCDYMIEYKDFFIPLQDCIQRDSLRSNPVGEKVITKIYNKYKDIIEAGMFNSTNNN